MTQNDEITDEIQAYENELDDNLSMPLPPVCPETFKLCLMYALKSYEHLLRLSGRTDLEYLTKEIIHVLRFLKKNFINDSQMQKDIHGIVSRISVVIATLEPLSVTENTHPIFGILLVKLFIIHEKDPKLTDEYLESVAKMTNIIDIHAINNNILLKILN